MKYILLLVIFTGITISYSHKISKRRSYNPGSMPIIYSDRYNIRLFGLQKLHPFDSEKYHKAWQYLITHGNLTADSFHRPPPVTDQELLAVHTSLYLKSLDKSAVVSRIAEMALLRVLPNSILQKKIIDPMRYGTGGTILGARLAMKKQWAINLSGGYHHAKSDHGEGFCFFADIPLAAHLLWKENPGLKILVIDLDAHQGNGIEAVFNSDPRVFIIDVYNRNVYPQDYRVMKNIDMNIPVSSKTSETEYLTIVDASLAKGISRFKPHLIIYNAGIDILKGDNLGRLNISERGILLRDEIVFTRAVKMKIPILMVLSGGYTKKSGQLAGKSILNILTGVIPLIQKK